MKSQTMQEIWLDIVARTTHNTPQAEMVLQAAEYANSHNETFSEPWYRTAIARFAVLATTKA